MIGVCAVRHAFSATHHPPSKPVCHTTIRYHLVDEDVWQRAQRLRESRGGPQIHKQRGPQRLLSGLVYCGCCGAKYNIATKDILRCSAKTNSGTCDGSRLVRMPEVEQRVLLSIERHLLSDEMFDAAVSAYRDEFMRAQGDRDSMRMRLESELTDVQKKFDRLMRLVEDGHADPAVAGPRLNELAAKKREIGGELALRTADAPRFPVGNGALSYRKQVEGLRLKAPTSSDEEREATQLVRGLVRRVVVLPREEDEPQGLDFAVAA